MAHSQRTLGYSVVCYYNLSLLKSSYMFLRRMCSAVFDVNCRTVSHASRTLHVPYSVVSRDRSFFKDFQSEQIFFLYFILFYSAGIPEDAEMVVKQFSHGQSNPTYLLILPDRKLVLRKKPPGTYFCFFSSRKKIHFLYFVKLDSKLMELWIFIYSNIWICDEAF
jgi:hypothetical protein